MARARPRSAAARLSEGTLVTVAGHPGGLGYGIHGLRERTIGNRGRIRLGGRRRLELARLDGPQRRFGGVPGGSLEEQLSFEDGPLKVTDHLHGFERIRAYVR